MHSARPIRRGRRNVNSVLCVTSIYRKDLRSHVKCVQAT